MIKKSAILLLCLLYTVSVYGIAFNVNYCGTAVQWVKVGAAMAKCPMCRGKVKMKCCKTNHVEVKVKDAHLANANVELTKVFAFAMVIPMQMNLVPVWKQTYAKPGLYHAQNAPPPGDDNILIKNCTFRI